MDIEKLIEQLKSAAGGPEGIKMCHAAATALSTLQTENERLRAAVDNWKKKYVEANGKWIEAENKWAGLDKAVRNGTVYRPMQEELNLTDAGTERDRLHRLAAYEEIGLEPGEIEQLKGEAFGLRVDKQELEQYRALGPIDRLRELAQADSMIGQTVYEPNNRGFISTYKVISIHISGCSVLVGWELLDGIYSNLNGFEISALGKTVFLTREEAEAALRRGQDG